MSAVKVQNISKSYGDISALQDINFEVEKAELFGLIGPDGAGKTSLIRILTTLLLADEGTASLQDFDVVRDFKKIRTIIGYMPGRFSLYQDLSVEENLNFFASVFETTIEENYHLIKDIYSHIEPFKKRKAGALSGGMKQKLALSCALIHKPEVLFLDEPTTGVDAVSRKEFWEMLKELQKKGITIIVSTPYMDEAEMCDRIALMQNGRILDIDSPEMIKKKFDRKIFALRSDDMYGLLKDIRNYEATYSVNTFGQFLHYIDKAENPDIDKLKSFLNKHENVVIKQIEPTIEDCFIEASQL